MRNRSSSDRGQRSGDYAAALRYLTPTQESHVTDTTGPVTGRNPLAPGTGRHRKP
ncbi:hypothetical protein ACODT5_17245 [Streptomyces sp. 5.8]|uniref:hypothetical protein n=1 Tax=Streptomyces sp. 5.8 TaxID=3406571 RepID=UPI003BB5B92D